MPADLKVHRYDVFDHVSCAPQMASAVIGSTAIGIHRSRGAGRGIESLVWCAGGTLLLRRAQINWNLRWDLGHGTAMRPQTRILFSLLVRLAVLGARSAPRDTGNQPRALRGYQGAEPAGWLIARAPRGYSVR